jgi:hypothetical protein
MIGVEENGHGNVGASNSSHDAKQFESVEWQVLSGALSEDVLLMDPLLAFNDSRGLLNLHLAFVGDSVTRYQYVSLM